MATDNRPLSPHLQVYRPQLTSVLSISHRITGLVLSAGSIVVVLWLMALAGGPERFTQFSAILSHPLAVLGLAVWSFCLFFHLLNGIRHLFWDAGWLLDLRGAYASGWTVVVLSVVLTAAIWGGLL